MISTELLKLGSILLSFTIIIKIFKSALFKGWIGEVFINLLIKIFLNKDDYNLIKNVTMPTESGTTQIDHIIVSKFGLFIVETKNMKGWIFGYKDDAQWTQKLFKVTHHFQNPLRQNYKHIKTLETALNIDIKSIFSVIVFVGDSTFKTKVPSNVTRPISFIRFIKSKKEIIFTEREVNRIIIRIFEERLSPTLKTHIKHVKHVKEIIKEKEIKTPKKLCHKCKSELVYQKSRYGENNGKAYWQCKNNCHLIV